MSACLDYLKSCAGRPGASAPWQEAPFLVDWRGATWSCATNGHGIAAVLGAEPGLSATAESSRVVPVLELQPSVAFVVAFSALAAFAATGTSVCSGCGGSPKPRMECPKCDGEGELVCHECEQERDCPRCDGTGEIGGCSLRCDRPVKPRLGLITPGVGLSLDVLRKFLGPLEADTVTVRCDGHIDPIAIDDNAGRWRLIIMPVRGTPSEAPMLCATAVDASTEPEAR